MGGNVSEWVQDFYEIGVLPSSELQVDPLGPERGAFHVFRGPSWRSATEQNLGLAYRENGADAREDLGFRIARSLTTSAPPARTQAAGATPAADPFAREPAEAP
jgi:formylglycine-generating enzyme required for sulfatase activity